MRIHTPQPCVPHSHKGSSPPTASQRYTASAYVPVRDGRLAAAAKDLCVKVGEAAGKGVGQPDAGLQVEAVVLQVVVQAAGLVVVRNQEHLAPAPRTPDVRGNEAQDVVVPHQNRLQIIDK